jgi:hypothetical protein
MADLSYIDKIYDQVVRGMPNEELDRVASAPPVSTPPSRDLATEAIVSFGPAILGALSGETGQIAQAPASKQARDQYEGRRKEEGAYIAKDKELQQKRVEAMAKQKQQDRENQRADESLGLKREEVDIKRKEAGSTSKDPEIKAATDLRKEFQGRPEIKRFSEVSTAFDKVQKAADNPSAAGDMSLIYGYMKMLDPGSTVREGEFANAQNAAGIPDKVLNIYNKAATGERLNPEQRKQFIESAQQAYQAELNSRQAIESEFGSLAGRYKVDPNLIYTPAKGVKKTTAPITKTINGVNYVKVEGGWQAQ